MISRLARVAAVVVGLASLAATLVPTAADAITPGQSDIRPASSSAATPADPVLGIPKPCKPEHPWPAGATPSSVKRQLAANTGITLVGEGWEDPKNTPMVKIIWETLEALDCTNYLDVVKKNNPGFTLNASRISGWAFGDWGLTRPGAVTLDLYKWHEPYQAGDRGRLVRLLVHEIGHAWSRTPEAQKAYNRFGELYARTGNFSDYGRGSANENFSEVIGYYVARCASGNPYDRAVRNQGQFDAYYALVKKEVFDGREFGPAVGRTPNCSLEPVVTKAPLARTVRRDDAKTVSRSAVRRVVGDGVKPTAAHRVLKEELDG